MGAILYLFIFVKRITLSFNEFQSQYYKKCKKAAKSEQNSGRFYENYFSFSKPYNRLLFSESKYLFIGSHLNLNEIFH